jgi:hypothetical protein
LAFDSLLYLLLAQAKAAARTHIEVDVSQLDHCIVNMLETVNMNRLAKLTRGFVPLFPALGLPLAVFGLLLFALTAHAQDDDPQNSAKPLRSETAIQVFTGRSEIDGGDFYELFGLESGDILYVYAKGVSGNLDPFVGLSDTRYEASTLSDAFWEQVDLVVAQGDDVLVALPEIYDSLFIAWDDDSGPGYSAAMRFTVPEDGQYQLLLTSSPAEDTFGDYELVLGRNAPQVLEGDDTEFGDPFALSDLDAAEERVAVQVVTGTLGIDTLEDHYNLVNLTGGEVLSAYVEAISGELTPVLILQDYGEKPVRSANLDGQESEAVLYWEALEDAEEYRLLVSTWGRPDAETVGAGAYRLVVGINDPNVETGRAQVTEEPVLLSPIKVRVGVELDQITNVDQVAENFSAVARLTMEWTDPLLAFSPDTCNCRFKVFTGDEFEKYATGLGIQWPQFTIFNQQGNRWIQNRNAVVVPDGGVRYTERFTTDFQAPDFDFTKFPFDTQKLYIRVHNLYPVEFFDYRAAPRLSAIGDQLGEEEWELTVSGTETTVEDDRSQFALWFEVHRHLNFYIFRIFVPIVLIIVVSWFTFFLNDYGKRVDVAAANLLVFVAFNFTVSGELPRLGYLTFMDAILIGVFAISAFVVVFNVFLKRLELNDKRELAERIDRFSIWIYPLAYGLGAFIAYWVFLHDGFQFLF